MLQQLTRAERRQLALCFLVSLAIHGLLLSLAFGGDEFGLPGFALPWQDRWIEAPELRVVLRQAPIAGAEPASMSVKARRRSASTAPTIAALADKPATTPSDSPVPAPPPGPATARAEAIVPVPATASLRSEESSEAPPRPAPPVPVIAMERSDEPAFIVPPPPPTPTPNTADAPGPSNPDTAMQAPEKIGEATQARAVEAPAPDPSEAARAESARQEAERQDAARRAAEKLEAQRQEAERDEAARQEAERKEAARQAAEKREAQRQEAARQEAARTEAARQEAERREAARQAAEKAEAQRQEAARRDAAHQESARVEAARHEAARAEAARAEAARVQAEKEEDARREARRQAMGRQLEEEAARREANMNSARLPARSPQSSTLRRVRLWGRADSNAELVQYAEAWARKIHFNTPVDTVRDVANRPHVNPMVTVAIRSDGSVESVTFVISSGVTEVDEAIRRIVHSHAPYQSFPPALARDYDVVEIRRTWYFDMAVRLY